MPPGWERRARAWLLDACPPEYRGYPVILRHPVLLVRLAARQVAGQAAATDTALATVRADLAGVLGEAGVATLEARHAAEIAELDERVKRTGERGAGRKVLAERHKRELRRLRHDELRFGLATLAGAYRKPR